MTNEAIVNVAFLNICYSVKLKDYLLLFLVWTIMRHVSGLAARSRRFQDESFPPVMHILSQNVTCGKNIPGRFVAPTYTCADLKINGRRMAYGYYSGWAVGQEDQRCQETAGVHEFAQLCLLLLKSISVEKLGFKAAYIPKSTCAYLNETRKLLKKVSPTEYVWTDFKPGWGWTETIQCMTDKSNV
ncbi:hypothetical protein BsWGS_24184 [Bradybaena similaris]